VASGKLSITPEKYENLRMCLDFIQNIAAINHMCPTAAFDKLIPPK